MASIRCFPHGLASMSYSNIQICTAREGISVHEIDIAKVGIPEKSADGKDENSEKQCSENGKSVILCCGFSASWRYLGVSDDRKRLLLYDAKDAWRLISIRSVSKRCSALAFTNDDSHILVADRHGDVYRFSVTKATEEGTLLLGHLSMLLDIVITRNDKFIVTCDRDEKIRISNYPNAYNIHGYCLRHTEYVSSLIYIENEDLVISGGRDGRIIVWDLDGRVKAAWDTEERETTPIKKLVYNPECKVLASISYSTKDVRLYQLTTTDMCIGLDHSVTVSLQSVPWDVDFDSDCRLWVLQPVEGSTVRVFQCHCDSSTNSKVQVKEITAESGADNSVTGVVQHLNSQWDFFKASFEVEDFSQYLKKKPIDSFTEYLQDRKESKPHRQKTALNTQELNPDSKKAKVS